MVDKVERDGTVVGDQIQKDALGKGATEGLSSMSPAQLRAHKRRQKILSRGETGADKITRTRDDVAAASRKELNESGSDGDEAAGEEQHEELASWEKKWKKSADKAPVSEVDFSASAAPVTATSEIPASTDSTLKQRKKDDKKETQDEQSTEDQATNLSMNAFREKLRITRGMTNEARFRTLMVFVLAFVSGIYLATQSILVRPSEVVGYQEADLSEKVSSFEKDMEDDGVELDISGNEFLDNGVQLNMLNPPLYGWISIPVLLFVLRAFVHFGFSFVYSYPFSLSSSPDIAGKDSSSSFPLSILTSLGKGMPVIGTLMASSYLMKSFLGDIISFVVILLVTTATMDSVAKSSSATFV